MVAAAANVPYGQQSHHHYHHGNAQKHGNSLAAMEQYARQMLPITESPQKSPLFNAHGYVNGFPAALPLSGMRSSRITDCCNSNNNGLTPPTCSTSAGAVGGVPSSTLPLPQPTVSNANLVATSNASSAAAANGTGTTTTAAQFNLIQEIKSLPQGEQLQIALAAWEWIDLDGVKLPCVQRGPGLAGEKFLAVHMVQMRLLAKFPPNVPGEIMRRFTMVSHKMSVLEAWIFNTVNALDCKHEFGYQLFTPNDEVVKLMDVERFYWAVKQFNITRMIDLYRTEIRTVANLHTQLTSHVSSLKSQADHDLRNLFVPTTAMLPSQQIHGSPVHSRGMMMGNANVLTSSPGGITGGRAASSVAVSSNPYATAYHLPQSSVHMPHMPNAYDQSSYAAAAAAAASFMPHMPPPSHQHFFAAANQQYAANSAAVAAMSLDSPSPGHFRFPSTPFGNSAAQRFVSPRY